MQGYVNSIQSLGALDGPGIRFTVFMQGCNLRCGCCHNPETWECNKGVVYSVEELVSKAERFREYFGDKGGITLTGGEPLIQAEFCAELFKLCKEKQINTCLDTSGSIINEAVLELLSYTDRVLLDIKYTEDTLYEEYVGCSMQKTLSFLEETTKLNIPVTLRQVVIPTLNDNEKNIQRLNAIAEKHLNVDGVELLPFKKLCSVKYDKEGIPFRFADIPTPTVESMKLLNSLLVK